MPLSDARNRADRPFRHLQRTRRSIIAIRPLIAVMVVALFHDSPINTTLLWTVGGLIAVLGPAALVPILLDRRGHRERAAVLDSHERAILGLLIAVLPWLSLETTGTSPWTHLMLIVFVTVSAGQALINLQDPSSNRSNFVILTILSISYIIAFFVADVPLLGALGLVWTFAVSQGARAAHDTQEELTELKQAGERAARHDDLTGLLNRSGMREKLESVLGAEDDWSFVLLDLNGFKKINDTLGHGTGDEVLRLVGSRIERSLPVTARCSRMGGDEFAVLLPRASTDPIASSTITALIGAIQEPMSIGEHALHVGVSAGLAPICPNDGIADVLLHSDHAMYKAKRTAGQDLAIFSEHIGAAISRRDSLERRLRSALDNEEIVFHAQPIVRLDDLSPTGVELLARWPQADGSVISPAEFIPVAEETGMIIDLGRHALATAASLLAGWQDSDEFGHLQVSINVSARHLDSGLVHDVIGTFEDRLLVRRLAMDFVESELITADGKTEIELRRLASLGASLAVDDFGVGYSSLTTLRSLPMTNLKIDRFFVSEIERSERAYLLLASIVAMSGALGLPTIAEGIESDEELAVLRELGVDHGQGYHVARPAALDVLEPELRRLGSLAQQTLTPRP